MREYEVVLKIENAMYVDQLIVSLVRQGYEVYRTYEGDIAFKTTEDEVTEIKR